MLKYFSMFAMLAILIVFSTLGMTKEDIKEIKQHKEEENTPKLINTNFHFLTPEAKRQVLCLANNIYFEARSEPVKGQIAVAFVTLNRVHSDLFPDNICDVVKQKVKGTCQFSWYCETRPKRQYTQHVLTGSGSLLYNETVELATFIYANHDKLNDPSHGSLFYHADYVRPGWRKRMDKVAVIGAHIFYRLRET